MSESKEKKSNKGSRSPYIETFDNGAGGWVANAHEPLPVWDGTAYCYSPWYVDANHAAGYLHLLMWIHTAKKWVTKPERPNRFISENKSRNLTNAKLTVRLRGEMFLAGKKVYPYATPEWTLKEQDEADLLSTLGVHLLVQTEGPKHDSPLPNVILTGQSLKVTREWSEQTLTLTPDPAQWTQCGARHDLKHLYDVTGNIPDVLADVNVDIIFVLFPLKIVPVGKVDDIHHQWADKDYRVDRRFLPKGLVMFDTVRIDYPD